jgi:hypothetical protein
MCVDSPRPSRSALLRTNWLGDLLSGMLLPPLGSILVAHEPIDGPKKRLCASVNSSLTHDRFSPLAVTSR